MMHIPEKERNKPQMLTPSFFKKNLKLSSLSIGQILEKLQTIFGCVYLENDHQPILGLLPLHYCVQFKDKFSCYTRHVGLKYLQNETITSFDEFVQFSPTKKDLKLQGFNGGYIGFFDYNFAASKHIRSNLKAQPNAFIGNYQSFLTCENGEWYFISTEKQSEQIFEQVLQALDRTTKPNFELLTSCTAHWKKSDYRSAFDKVQAYIRAGDCYQINLTQAFSAKAQGQLIYTADRFWKLTNAPYSGYLKIDDFEILSCSPELFIDFEVHGKITTKPIKGTMPRYTDIVKDEASKQALINSQKDQAENVMIVDLLRNDLSVFAEIGSVQTPKLFEIESFNQVHHMVSEVTATLQPEVNPLDVLLNALPGGSITGAPKIRAMQIIEELEPTQRGVYCGSMGYFNFDGTGSWNILIRTIQKQADDISIWAGGGVTTASACDAEYQECFDKVEAMLDLLNTYHKAD